jgi:hypothetical protein
MQAWRKVEVYICSFFNLGGRWEWLVKGTARPKDSGERDPLPIVQESGWTEGRCGRVQKITPSPGFLSWAVHPVASRYPGPKFTLSKKQFMIFF